MRSEQTESNENITITKSEKKGFNLSVKKIVLLEPPLSETIAEEMAQFWRKRRVTFLDVTDKTMSGKRGSLWWNAITFDMSKLRSDLTINLDKYRGVVECSLDIKTALQQITPMNQMYWVEEMAAFESYLKSGDEKKRDWAEFQREYRKDNIRWIWGIIITVGVAVIGSQIIGGLLSWLIGLFKTSK